MKKLILATVIMFGTLYANDVVKYDTKDVKKPAITKPNHPTNDLYTQK